jgi:hypothetical protein
MLHAWLFVWTKMADWNMLVWTSMATYMSAFMDSNDAYIYINSCFDWLLIYTSR